SQQSALTAKPTWRGSTTISFAPRARASAILVAAARSDVLGLCPQSRMQPARAESGGPVLVPGVRARAKVRCQLQRSQELQLFGEPNALTNRSTHGCASDNEVPALVVTPNATASEPLSAAIRRRVASVSSSA